MSDQTFLYFAYGSNTLSTRLQARCPSARAIGTALAPDHALEFGKKSVDGSGKATLVRRAPGIATPGVVFEVALGERDALDSFEGAGTSFAGATLGYHRVDEFRIDMAGRSVPATTYFAATLTEGLVPFDWYVALIVAGALEHGLGDDHLARLRLSARVPDDTPSRATRRAALDALLNAGHPDHLALLEG